MQWHYIINDVKKRLVDLFCKMKYFVFIVVKSVCYSKKDLIYFIKNKF